MKLVLSAFVVLFALVSARAIGQAPTGPPATGLILGRVVEADSNKAIASIMITLRDIGAEQATGRAAPARATVTDTEGRFVFRGVRKSSYQVMAMTGGGGFSPSDFIVSGSAMQVGRYLNGGFGQRRPGGPIQTFDFADGQRIGDMTIRMWKGGSIDGMVVDETGEPLVGVAVAAARRTTDGRLGTGPATATDDRGFYHLPTLPPGEYFIVVPQRQQLMPLETLDELLARPQPIQASQSRFNANGAPSPLSSGVRVGGVVSQAANAYVNNGFAPVQQQGRLFVYQSTFFPSATTLAQATPIAIRAGEERNNLTIRLQPVPAVEVSGTLMDDGGPVAHFGVHLRPADSGDGTAVLEVAQAATNSKGEFKFPLVPSGRYQLLAYKPAASVNPMSSAPVPDPRTIGEWSGATAEQEISVATEPVRDIRLRMRLGAQLSGRVEFRGTSERPPIDRLTKMTVSAPLTQPLFRAETLAPAALLDAEGAFTLRYAQPGRILLRVQDLGPPWTLQSVTVNGQDVTDAGVPVTADSSIANISIVLTDRPAEIAGTVESTAAGTASDNTVFLFPTNRARWPDARVSTRTFRAARVSSTGAFRFANVIPGEYAIVAVPDELSVDWPDQRLLAKWLALATTMRIDVAQKAAITLRTVNVR